MSKAKIGTTICSLDDLCFPIELRDNPRDTNREYSKVITGTFNKSVPFHTMDEMQDLIEDMDSDEAILFLESFPDTKEISYEKDLNYCSPVYELVPNEVIFPKVEEILRRHKIKFSVVYSHTQNTRFYGNYTIEDKRFTYKMNGTNDVIKFIWNFQHSYNGLTKYKGIAGFYRLVCENGLVIPVQEMKEYNLCIEGKHTSAILKSLENFANILVNVTKNIKKVKTSIVQKYELLGGRDVPKLRDRVTEVLKANKIAMVENAKFNTLNDITENIMSEAKGVKTDIGYNGKVNDWLVYNGINQYIHDDTRNIASPEKRRETDSKVLEYMLEFK